MTSLKTAAAAAVLAGALALCASSALARAPLTTVHCGQTLTTSVRLANDLTDCPGDGLVAGADGITVDLDGHTIDGVASTACDRPDAPSHGIADAGNDGVTIENGTVRQFDFGVSAGSATDGLSNGRIHHMTLVDDTFGGVSLGTGGGAALMAGDRIDHNVVRLGLRRRSRANGGRDHRSPRTASWGATRYHHPLQRQRRRQRGPGQRGQRYRKPWNLLSARRRTTRRQQDPRLGRHRHPRQRPDERRPCQGQRHRSHAGDGLLRRAVLWRQPGRAERGAHRGDTRRRRPTASVIQSDGNEASRNTVLATGTFGDPADFGVGVLIDAGSRELVAGNTLANGRGPGVMVGVPPDLELLPGRRRQRCRARRDQP